VNDILVLIFMIGASVFAWIQYNQNLLFIKQLGLLREASGISEKILRGMNENEKNHEKRIILLEEGGLK